MLVGAWVGVEGEYVVACAMLTMVVGVEDEGWTVGDSTTGAGLLVL